MFLLEIEGYVADTMYSDLVFRVDWIARGFRANRATQQLSVTEETIAQATTYKLKARRSKVLYGQ